MMRVLGRGRGRRDRHGDSQPKLSVPKPRQLPSLRKEKGIDPSVRLISGAGWASTGGVDGVSGAATGAAAVGVGRGRGSLPAGGNSGVMPGSAPGGAGGGAQKPNAWGASSSQPRVVPARPTQYGGFAAHAKDFPSLKKAADDAAAGGAPGTAGAPGDGGASNNGADANTVVSKDQFGQPTLLHSQFPHASPRTEDTDDSFSQHVKVDGGSGAAASGPFGPRRGSGNYHHDGSSHHRQSFDRRGPPPNRARVYDFPPPQQQQHQQQHPENGSAHHSPAPAGRPLPDLSGWKPKTARQQQHDDDEVGGGHEGHHRRASLSSRGSLRQQHQTAENGEYRQSQQQEDGPGSPSVHSRGFDPSDAASSSSPGGVAVQNHVASASPLRLGVARHRGNGAPEASPALSAISVGASALADAPMPLGSSDWGALSPTGSSSTHSSVRGILQPPTRHLGKPAGGDDVSSSGGERSLDFRNQLNNASSASSSQHNAWQRQASAQQAPAAAASAWKPVGQPRSNATNNSVGNINNAHQQQHPSHPADAGHFQPRLMQRPKQAPALPHDSQEDLDRVQSHMNDPHYQHSPMMDPVPDAGSGAVAPVVAAVVERHKTEQQQQQQQHHQIMVNKQRDQQRRRPGQTRERDPTAATNHARDAPRASQRRPSTSSDQREAAATTRHQSPSLGPQQPKDWRNQPRFPKPVATSSQAHRAADHGRGGQEQPDHHHADRAASSSSSSSASAARHEHDRDRRGSHASRGASPMIPSRGDPELRHPHRGQERGEHSHGPPGRAPPRRSSGEDDELRAPPPSRSSNARGDREHDTAFPTSAPVPPRGGSRSRPLTAEEKRLKTEAHKKRLADLKAKADAEAKRKAAAEAQAKAEAEAKARAEAEARANRNAWRDRVQERERQQKEKLEREQHEREERDRREREKKERREREQKERREREENERREKEQRDHREREDRQREQRGGGRERDRDVRRDRDQRDRRGEPREPTQRFPPAAPRDRSPRARRDRDDSRGQQNIESREQRPSARPQPQRTWQQKQRFENAELPQSNARQPPRTRGNRDHPDSENDRDSRTAPERGQRSKRPQIEQYKPPSARRRETESNHSDGVSEPSPRHADRYGSRRDSAHHRRNTSGGAPPSVASSRGSENDRQSRGDRSGIRNQRRERGDDRRGDRDHDDRRTPRNRDRGGGRDDRDRGSDRDYDDRSASRNQRSDRRGRGDANGRERNNHRRNDSREVEDAEPQRRQERERDREVSRRREDRSQNRAPRGDERRRNERRDARSNDGDERRGERERERESTSPRRARGERQKRKNDDKRDNSRDSRRPAGEQRSSNPPLATRGHQRTNSSRGSAAPQQEHYRPPSQRNQNQQANASSATASTRRSGTAAAGRSTDSLSSPSRSREASEFGGSGSVAGSTFTGEAQRTASLASAVAQARRNEDEIARLERETRQKRHEERVRQKQKEMEQAKIRNRQERERQREEALASERAAAVSSSRAQRSSGGGSKSGAASSKKKKGGLQGGGSSAATRRGAGGSGGDTGGGGNNPPPPPPPGAAIVNDDVQDGIAHADFSSDGFTSVKSKKKLREEKRAQKAADAARESEERIRQERERLEESLELARQREHERKEALKEQHRISRERLQRRKQEEKEARAREAAARREQRESERKARDDHRDSRGAFDSARREDRAYSNYEDERKDDFSPRPRGRRTIYDDDPPSSGAPPVKPTPPGPSSGGELQVDLDPTVVTQPTESLYMGSQKGSRAPSAVDGMLGSFAPSLPVEWGSLTETDVVDGSTSSAAMNSSPARPRAATTTATPPTVHRADRILFGNLHSSSVQNPVHAPVSAPHHRTPLPISRPPASTGKSVSPGAADIASPTIIGGSMSDLSSPANVGSRSVRVTSSAFDGDLVLVGGTPATVLEEDGASLLDDGARGLPAPTRFGSLLVGGADSTDPGAEVATSVGTALLDSTPDADPVSSKTPPLGSGGSSSHSAQSPPTASVSSTADPFFPSASSSSLSAQYPIGTRSAPHLQQQQQHPNSDSAASASLDPFASAPWTSHSTVPVHGSEDTPLVAAPTINLGGRHDSGAAQSVAAEAIASETKPTLEEFLDDSQHRGGEHKSAASATAAADEGAVGSILSALSGSGAATSAAEATSTAADGGGYPSASAASSLTATAAAFAPQASGAGHADAFGAPPTPVTDYNATQSSSSTNVFAPQGYTTHVDQYQHRAGVASRPNAFDFSYNATTGGMSKASHNTPTPTANHSYQPQYLSASASGLTNTGGGDLRAPSGVGALSGVQPPSPLLGVTSAPTVQLPSPGVHTTTASGGGALNSYYEQMNAHFVGAPYVPPAISTPRDQTRTASYNAHSPYATGVSGGTTTAAARATSGGGYHHTAALTPFGHTPQHGPQQPPSLHTLQPPSVALNAGSSATHTPTTAFSGDNLSAHAAAASMYPLASTTADFHAYGVDRTSSGAALPAAGNLGYSHFGSNSATVPTSTNSGAIPGASGGYDAQRSTYLKSFEPSPPNTATGTVNQQRHSLTQHQPTAAAPHAAASFVPSYMTSHVQPQLQYPSQQQLLEQQQRQYLLMQQQAQAAASALPLHHSTPLSAAAQQHQSATFGTANPLSSLSYTSQGYPTPTAGAASHQFSAATATGYSPNLSARSSYGSGFGAPGSLSASRFQDGGHTPPATVATTGGGGGNVFDGHRRSGGGGSGGGSGSFSRRMPQRSHTVGGFGDQFRNKHTGGGGGARHQSRHRKRSPPMNKFPPSFDGGARGPRGGGGPPRPGAGRGGGGSSFDGPPAPGGGRGANWVPRRLQQKPGAGAGGKA